MSIDLYEATTKKSVHISLAKSTHRQFKSITSSYGLSMQEVFEELATRAAEYDENVIEMMKNLSESKKLGINNKRLVGADIDDIYELFENCE
jgi:ribosome assembly protein YihI (activator of Der GTPase)